MDSLLGLAEPIGLVVGFLLTLMVLSYIIGDNPLFRLAVYIFVGVASGYAAAVLLYNVVYYQVIVPLLQDPMTNLGIAIPALLLFLWLLAKGSPRLSRLGNPLLAFLVGVGAATALGGAVLGTIFQQIGATASLFDLKAAVASGRNVVSAAIFALVILAGAVTSLAYFHFGVRVKGEGLPPQRSAIVENLLAPVGQFFIAVTLGVLFAGVYAAALSALVDRLGFLLEVILHFAATG